MTPERAEGARLKHLDTSTGPLGRLIVSSVESTHASAMSIAVSSLRNICCPGFINILNRRASVVGGLALLVDVLAKAAVTEQEMRQREDVALSFPPWSDWQGRRYRNTIKVEVDSVTSSATSHCKLRTLPNKETCFAPWTKEQTLTGDTDLTGQ